MSILGDLVQFGNIQSTTLDLCQSPKIMQLPHCPPFMTAQKQTIPESDRPRPASKSLTKMSFFTSVQKIDPKERIIHRLIYKLEMKCRKHYYNFFVRLQNFKKKPVSMKNNKLLGLLPNVIVKLNQTSELLFSKYFQRSLVKESFQKIRRMAQIKEGLKKISKLTINRKVHQYFSKIVQHSKQIEKNHIRIDILVSSIKTIEAAMRKREYKNQLKVFAFTKIIKYAASIVSSPTPKLIALESCTQESGSVQNEVVVVKSLNWLSQADIVPNPAYQALKTAKQTADKSPIRPSQQIKLSIGKKYKNPFHKANYLKTHPISSNKIIDEPIRTAFEPQYVNAVVKRCEADYLNSQQVHDIHDNNTLFFQIDIGHSQKVYSTSSERQMSFFSQSIVEPVQLEHTHSHVSLISPLCDRLQVSSHNISSSSAKYNSFGLQAVNFKNSLISQRQSMKDHLLGERKMQNTQELVFKKNSFSKQAKKSQLRTDQFWSTGGHQTGRKSHKDQMQNDWHFQAASKDTDFTSRPMLKSSARVPIIQSQSRLGLNRKSVDQAKLTPVKDDSRRAPQTFLKITKKN